MYLNHSFNNDFFVKFIRKSNVDYLDNNQTYLQYDNDDAVSAVDHQC